MADFQLPDEESPLRGEFFDKCFTDNPAKGAFRPHETVLPHLVRLAVTALAGLALLAARHGAT